MVKSISYVSPYYQQASHAHTAPDKFIYNKKENMGLQLNAYFCSVYFTAAFNITKAYINIACCR